MTGRTRSGALCRRCQVSKTGSCGQCRGPASAAGAAASSLGAALDAESIDEGAGSPQVLVGTSSGTISQADIRTVFGGDNIRGRAAVPVSTRPVPMRNGSALPGTSLLGNTDLYYDDDHTPGFWGYGRAAMKHGAGVVQSLNHKLVDMADGTKVTAVVGKPLTLMEGRIERRENGSMGTEVRLVPKGRRAVFASGEVHGAVEGYGNFDEANALVDGVYNQLPAHSPQRVMDAVMRSTNPVDGPGEFSAVLLPGGLNGSPGTVLAVRKVADDDYELWRLEGVESGPRPRRSEKADAATRRGPTGRHFYSVKTATLGIATKTTVGELEEVAGDPAAVLHWFHKSTHQDLD